MIGGVIGGGGTLAGSTSNQNALGKGIYDNNGMYAGVDLDIHLPTIKVPWVDEKGLRHFLLSIHVLSGSYGKAF